MFALRGADKADRADASYWRRMAKAAPTSFDLSSDIGVVDEIYDGAATIRTGDDERRVRVRLSGRLDPIDGRYHWQGTVFDALSDEVLTGPKPVTLTIGDRSAECRITERTPQGRYSVVGVGTPPYALDDVEVVVPTGSAARGREADCEHRPTTPETRSGRLPSAPHNRPAQTPAIRMAKPLAPWKTPCALPCRSDPTSDEIHALATPSVHPVNRP